MTHVRGTDVLDFVAAAFGGLLRQLYQKGHPIIALCAAGIVIRSLATVLGEKDPPQADG